MATETTKNEQLGRREDPAQSDTDPNQIADDGGAGPNEQMYDELSEAQTAGSRNDRATEYDGPKRSVEPTTASEYPTGVPSKEAPASAPGITNRTVGEERAGQEKVMHGRAEEVTVEDADGLPAGSREADRGGAAEREGREGEDGRDLDGLAARGASVLRLAEAAWRSRGPAEKGPAGKKASPRMGWPSRLHGQGGQLLREVQLPLVARPARS